MFYLYDKRKVIKVEDGLVTKYLVLVLRDTDRHSYIDHIWCPLTNLTEDNGYIEKFTPTTQFLYTEDELKEMINALPDIHRYRPGRPNTNTKEWFEKWIMDGIKSAMTPEEHVIARNTLSIVWQSHPLFGYESEHLNTSEKLLSMDKGLRTDPPKKVTIHFDYINLKSLKRASLENDYYIIKTDTLFEQLLIARMGANKIIFAKMKNEIMRFPSEDKALDYCEKYKDKLGDVVQEIIHIEDKEHLLSVIKDYNITIH